MFRVVVDRAGAVGLVVVVDQGVEAILAVAILEVVALPA